MLFEKQEWTRGTQRRTVRYLVQGALIAALYAALTILIAPISSGLFQCRLTEALCVLAYFTPAAVPGLFLGCLLANLLTGAVALDVIFGSLATLLAALTSWLLRNVRIGRFHAGKWLSPLPSVVLNAAIVGALLCYAYQVGVSYPIAALYVGAGQALACFGLGLPLLIVLERFGKGLFH